MDLKDHKIKRDKIHFWYRAKAGFVRFLLKSAADGKTEKNILEIGCGTGFLLPIISEFGRVIGIDMNNEALAVARKKGFPTEQIDAEKSPLPIGPFDIICCFDMIEHLEDDLGLLKKASLSLKNRGYLIITAPAFQALFGPHDIALEHKRRYSNKKIAKLLSRAGFRVEKSGYWNFWLFPLEAAWRLSKKILFMSGLSKPGVETGNLPAGLDDLFFIILNSETAMIKRGLEFPFGLSVYAVARKN